MSFGNKNDNQRTNPYAAIAANYVPAAHATVSDRIGFIQKTYLHLAGAVLVFVAIEAVIFAIYGEQLINVVSKLGGMMWLVVLGAFMGASFLANRWANSQTSSAVQYAGLGLYVVAQALIFVPILAIADNYFPGAIMSAGVITAIVFAGLTITVFVTQVDFSFLRMALVVGSLAAFTAIIVGMFLPVSIFGALFSSLMVVLASGYILYDTSNVLHKYRTDQHVAASLALFSGVALLFWYILRLVMVFRE